MKKGNTNRSKKRQFTEEHRRHLSEALTGMIFTQKHKDNLSKSHKGKKHSKETIQKIIAGNKGKKRSEEQKRTISVAQQLRYYKNKHPAYWTGRKRSEETKQKISESIKKTLALKQKGIVPKPKTDEYDFESDTTYHRYSKQELRKMRDMSPEEYKEFISKKNKK